jgi:hypothetical protein
MVNLLHHRIQHPHFVSSLQQGIDEVRADEAGAARYKYPGQSFLPFNLNPVPSSAPWASPWGRFALAVDLRHASSRYPPAAQDAQPNSPEP